MAARETKRNEMQAHINLITLGLVPNTTAFHELLGCLVHDHERGKRQLLSGGTVRAHHVWGRDAQ